MTLANFAYILVSWGPENPRTTCSIHPGPRTSRLSGPAKRGPGLLGEHLPRFRHRVNPAAGFVCRDCYVTLGPKMNPDTLKKALLMYPDAPASEWIAHSRGGGLKHVLARVDDYAYIHPSSIVGPGAKIYDRVEISSDTVIDGEATIRYGAVIGSGVHVSMSATIVEQYSVEDNSVVLPYAEIIDDGHYGLRYYEFGHNGRLIIGAHRTDARPVQQALIDLCVKAGERKLEHHGMHPFRFAWMIMDSFENGAGSGVLESLMEMVPDGSSERHDLSTWAISLMPGHTPANHAVCALFHSWLVEQFPTDERKRGGL